MSLQFLSFKIGENDSLRRVDRVLRKMLKTKSLSNIYASLRKGLVRVNGKKVKSNYLLQSGDDLQMHKSLLDKSCKIVDLKSSQKPFTNQSQSKSKRTILIEKKSLADNMILYSDNDFLVLDKPRFSLVHGVNSLDETVKKIYTETQDKIDSLSFTPGPLHRLDYGTSGIVVFSKSLKGAQNFSKNLRDGKILRFYLAIVLGQAPGSCIFNTPINEKKAFTKLKLLKYFDHKNISLVQIQILTGRKHQIRIHCAKNGLPLLGDTLTLNAKKNKAHYFLHFYKITFNEQILSLPKIIKSPIPKYFFNALN